MSSTARIRRTGTRLVTALATAAALTLGSPLAPVTGALASTKPPQPPPGGNLTSVSCPSASFCIAVGVPDDDSSLVLMWNGSTWQKQSLPAGQDLIPQAVSCVSADFCVAAGSDSAVTNGSPLILTWNGTAWAVHPSPTLKGGGFSAVSCTSATACLAVGDIEPVSGNDQPLVERWNGLHWFPIYVPVPEGVNTGLDAVSCSSARACTAAGGYYSPNTQIYTPLLERWNGVRLIRQQSAQPAARRDPSNISGVSCPTATGCIAVGDVLDTPIVQEWNGTTWTELTIPGGDGQLLGVSCTAITACTDVGYHLADLLAERLQGTTWSIDKTPLPTGATGASFRAVSCVSATHCAAAGLYSTGSEQDFSLAERWNGTNWALQPTPNNRAGQR